MNVENGAMESACNGAHVRAHMSENNDVALCRGLQSAQQHRRWWRVSLLAAALACVLCLPSSALAQHTARAVFTPDYPDMPGWPDAPNLPPFPPTWVPATRVVEVEAMLLGDKLSRSLEDKKMQLYLAIGLCQILKLSVAAECQIDRAATRLELGTALGDKMVVVMKLREQDDKAASLDDIAELLWSDGDAILRTHAGSWLASFGISNPMLRTSGVPPSAPAPPPPAVIPLDLLLALGLAPPPPPVNSLPLDLLLLLGLEKGPPLPPVPPRWPNAPPPRVLPPPVRPIPMLTTAAVASSPPPPVPPSPPPVREYWRDLGLICGITISATVVLLAGTAAAWLYVKRRRRDAEERERRKKEFDPEGVALGRGSRRLTHESHPALGGSDGDNDSIDSGGGAATVAKDEKLRSKGGAMMGDVNVAMAGFKAFFKDSKKTRPSSGGSQHSDLDSDGRSSGHSAADGGPDHATLVSPTTKGEAGGERRSSDAASRALANLAGSGSQRRRDKHAREPSSDDRMEGGDTGDDDDGADQPDAVTNIARTGDPLVVGPNGLIPQSLLARDTSGSGGAGAAAVGTPLFVRVESGASARGSGSALTMVGSGSVIDRLSARDSAAGALSSPSRVSSRTSTPWAQSTRGTPDSLTHSSSVSRAAAIGALAATPAARPTLGTSPKFDSLPPPSRRRTLAELPKTSSGPMQFMGGAPLLSPTGDAQGAHLPHGADTDAIEPPQGQPVQWASGVAALRRATSPDAPRAPGSAWAAGSVVLLPPVAGPTDRVPLPPPPPAAGGVWVKEEAEPSLPLGRRPSLGPSGGSGGWMTSSGGRPLPGRLPPTSSLTPLREVPTLAEVGGTDSSAGGAAGNSRA